MHGRRRTAEMPKTRRQWRPKKRPPAAKALSGESMSGIFSGQNRVSPFEKERVRQYAATSGILQVFSMEHFTLRTLAHGYTSVQ
jgi:hypothetical protein